MTTEIFKLIPTIEEIDDTAREKDFVKGFISQNQKYFLDATPASIEQLPCVYGKFENDFVYINKEVLKKACESSGFNYDKIVADLIADEFFIPSNSIPNGRKKTYNFVQKKINRINTSCFRIPAKLI